MKCSAALRPRIRLAACGFGIIALVLAPPNRPILKAAPASPTSSRTARDLPAVEQARIRQAFDTLAMRFEAADATTRDRASYAARGANYSVVVAPTHARVALNHDGAYVAFAMRLPGANRYATPVASNKLDGTVNYLLGNVPARWRSHVRAFGRVEYRDVYPGVDVAYYGTQSHLEFDFVAAPGADLSKIGLTFDGVDRVTVNERGDLTLTTGHVTMVQRAPVAYQKIDGRRRYISAGYVRRGHRRIGIHVGRYDRSRTLVIDPVLAFSTYLGESGTEGATGIAVDGAGAIYVTGQTYGSREDAFVAKLSADGQSLVYWTYLGGSAHDESTGIAIDGAGNAFVSGLTVSADFPVQSALQASLRGVEDAFVTKLDPTGALVYSTYLGGRDQDWSVGIGVDAYGSAYVTGGTISSDFPIANAVQPTFGGSRAYRSGDGSTWTPSETGLATRWVWSMAVDPADAETVYAGTYGDGVFKSIDFGTTWTSVNTGLTSPYVYAIAFDQWSNSTYVATEGGVFKSTDGGATWISAGFEGFVIRTVTVSPGDPATVYVAVVPTFSEFPADVFKSVDGGVTWEETNVDDNIETLAIDPTAPDVIYAAGMNGVYTSYTGGGSWNRAAFGQVHVVVVDGAHPSIIYAGADQGLFKSVDRGASWSPTTLSGTPVTAVSTMWRAPGADAIYAAGNEQPVVVSLDQGLTWAPAGLDVRRVTVLATGSNGAIYAGTYTGADAFVTKLTPAGDAIVYSTLLGGAGWDVGGSIAVGTDGSAFIAGTTDSDDFPTTHALQTTRAGGYDAFVTRLGPEGRLAYSTYLGGSDYEDAPAIAVDGLGRAHVAGQTFSDDFPTTSAFQATRHGSDDLFIATLEPSGEALTYSTYFGGSQQDDTAKIAVDGSGVTYVAGVTNSTDFPVRNAVQASRAGSFDAFVAAFDGAGSLVYSTYLGGSGDDSGGGGIAAGPTGTAYVTGSTWSADFPTRNALMPMLKGGGDAFVAAVGPEEADSTAPTSSIVLSGTVGGYGWFRSEVTVNIAATDNAGGSGIASIEFSLDNSSFQPYSAPFVISTDGTTEVRARATDHVGNVETPPVIELVKIDRVPPLLNIAAPHEGNYLHSDVLALDFNGTDAGSGLVPGSPAATLDGTAAADGQLISLLGVSLGDHTFVLAASDVAGNHNERQIVFRVTATIDSLKAAVTLFEQQGKIDPQLANNLMSMLDNAGGAVARGNLAVAQNKLNDFIDHVRAQNGKSISPDAAQVLIGDAEYVCANL